MPTRVTSRSLHARLPLRQKLVYLPAFLCLGCAVSMLAAGKLHSGVPQTLRGGLADGIMATLQPVSHPAEFYNRTAQWMGSIWNMREENRALKAQLTQLQSAQQEYYAVKAENNALRQLLPMIPTGTPKMAATRIISESGGPFARAALLQGGKSQGVAEGQPVLSADGLIGRVVEVSAYSSRVLLLTDINSRVPVTGEISGERAIIAGNNTDALSLTYTRPSQHFVPGERLLTSGEGGIFPPGLPVAKTLDIEKSLAQPLADMDALNYVSIARDAF